MGGSKHGGDRWWRTPAPDPEAVEQASRPLIDRLAACDRIVVGLATAGGDFHDLRALRELLVAPIDLSGVSVSLTQRREIDDALWSLCPDVQLDVRLNDDGLPAWHLSRRYRSWSTYDAVVNVLFRSERFPADVDGRFTRLMSRWGEATWYADLSRLRPALARWKEPRCMSAVDELLRRAYDNVLSAAWDEDQRFVMLVADVLEIPALRHVVELAYLVLNADPRLRYEVDADLIDFFERVHPNPMVRDLLASLPGSTGDEMAELAARGKVLYREVVRRLQQLLLTDVPWSAGVADVALYKVVQAHFHRRELLAALGGRDGGLRDVARRVDRELTALTSGFLAPRGACS